VFSSALLYDLTIIDNELKAVWEFDIQSLKYRDLLIVCSQLKIKGVKSSTKEQMIEKLVSLETPDLALTRKEPQCPYRLLNILFLDAFAEGFAQLGNVAAPTELDVGKAANNLFWEGIQEEFEGQDEAFKNMHFADDEVLSELHHINFKKIVPQDWKKLWEMWKHLNLGIKAALSRFTLSGMHSSNFFNFCDGCHEIYYLQKHLESKPELVATVVAELPEEVFMESSDIPS